MFRLVMTMMVSLGLLIACNPPNDGASEIASAPVPADGLGPLTGKVFGKGNQTLVVVLHGDISRGGTAESMYPRANEIAERFERAVVVSLLRPGYADDEGRRSPGVTYGRGDHYTPVNNRAVADTIANLKAATAPERVFALGYSGGAAQLGVIIGQNPELVDGAILLSCPCDIDKWRTLKTSPPWTRSQSPIDHIDGVARGTRVIAITGGRDDNTFPVLAEDYVEALQNRGVDARFVRVMGATHKYSDLRDAVLAAFDSLFGT